MFGVSRNKRIAIVLEGVAGAAFTGGALLMYAPLGLVVLGAVALLAAYTMTLDEQE